MRGTKAVHTRAIPFTPKRMTRAASRVTASPDIHVGMPIESWQSMLMALLCTMLPMPKEAIAVKIQKRTANHFIPNPF